MTKPTKKHEQHWAKFYWPAWLSEPTLRLVSLEAVGLWTYMLGLMFPTGELRHKGRPMSPEVLASILGRDPEMTRKCISELESEGTFSRDRNGVIFCRRTRRDYETFLMKSKAGKKGMNSRYGSVIADDITESVSLDITPSCSSSYSSSCSSSYSLKEGVGGRSRNYPAPKTAKKHWQAAAQSLEKTIDAENYETWIKPAIPLGHEKAKGEKPAILHLGAPSEFKRSWLARNYRDRIAEAMQDLTGKEYEIEFHAVQQPETQEQETA